MGIVAIIAKIMPDSPNANLEQIEKEALVRLQTEGAMNISFSIEPIAFGLKAIKAKFAWKEEKSTEIVESILSSIPNVSSATIEDYRRAFG